MIEAPEGTEFAIFVFLKSPSSGLDTRIAIEGMNRFVPLTGELAPERLLEKVNADRLADCDDWRLMTREEIVAYKTDQGRDHEQR